MAVTHRNGLNWFNQQNTICSTLIIMSWFNFANNIFQYDLELNFVDRINLFIRASCIASVPPLSNLFVIPILILIVEKFQRSNNLIEDTYHYQKFLDVNI